MFLLQAIDKRINDLTNQLLAMKVLGFKNEPKREKLLNELYKLTEQREAFYKIWSKNFPYWYR
jgi:hypothetical protein